ncbi:checkpoint clamp complex protein Rad1 [Neocucurbitaria cava]|uniref:Checkpoint clamp complex protein Rad1 n=1 Tax=Neocucurbitaria cava TaxID=798079 RepID=A0A9W8Y5J3_9PLEO|nr:checkpoint clamp complex protein Rad1 [Neocucurbitaria cava]
MSSPLLDVWEAAASSPFSPAVGKNTQFTVGFLLLFASLVLTTIFSLSMRTTSMYMIRHDTHQNTDRSLVNLPVLALPASVAFGFGAVYMICAVGVYVNMDSEDSPVLTAVSSSARQLYLLLRCIAFSPKAHVQIGEEGLKLSVDEASVMEASVFLDKSLFTTYNFNAPTPHRNSQHSSNSEDDDPDPSATTPTFQISLPALLETLQIFGLTDPNTTKPPWARDNPYPTSTAFSNNVLGMNNLCRISYDTLGAPLSIILTEASIRTQCDLTTYEAEYTDEIPFDRSALAFKTIMRGSWLHDAISELSSTSPEKLTMYAKTVKGKPFFALSSSGTLGSARVEFNNEPPQGLSGAYRTPASTNLAADPNNELTPTNLLETFQLSDEESVLRSTYKFSLVQKAARAMSVATKVSVRVDTQGVLSLQFMVEVEGGGGGGGASGVGNPAGSGGGGGGGKVSFVDFRFVPLVEDDDDDEEGDGVDDTVMQNGGGSDVGSAMDDDELM